MLTNNQINDLRKGFISDFNADLNGVRETIAKSWYRSKFKNGSALHLSLIHISEPTRH